MKTTIRKAMAMSKATFYVNPKGELIATNDSKRFFPIDGLAVFAFPSDETEIDTIKPFQFLNNGMCDYYPLVSKKAPDTDTVKSEQGNEAEPEMRHETEKNYDELADAEGDEDFIKEMDKGINGCAFWIALFIANGLLIAYGITKLL